MKSETIFSRVGIGAIALLAFLVIPSAPAAAQATEGSWRAFTGCWDMLDVPRPPTVCVIPTAEPAVVEIVTVSDGSIVERERVDATGARVTRVREGCSGWESAEWSADGRRLYMESEHRCDGGIDRRSHGIMSILPNGDWLSVQGVEVAGNTGVRVLRHRASEAPSAVRDELQAAVVGREFALEAARVAVAAPVTLPVAIEVSKRLPEAVVEAWLIEGEQTFDMNRARLLELADAGVPGSVIDVMVALSYPRVFAIDRASRRTEMQPGQQGYAQAARPYGGVYNPWFGYGPYRPFDFYRFGYASGYGMYPGYGFGWYGSRPTVIVVREPSQPQQQGRLVRGRGYQGSTSGSSGSATRSTGASSNTGSSAATSRSSGSSSSSSSGSTSSGSSSSSGGGRTAQPRQ